MKSKVSLKILFTLLLITQTLSKTTNLTFFLTRGESWLFFPHRYPLNTYTAECQLSGHNQTIQHPQLETISTFQVNNDCISIDILSDPSQVRSTFYYAKLTTAHCTIYKVNQSQITNYYRYETDGNYSSVLMLNQLNTLLWNDKQIVRIEYSFGNQVNAYQMSFESQMPRRCRQNTLYSAICWNNKQFIVLNFSKQGMETKTIPFDPERQYLIETILPLSPEEGIYFICESIVCNISKISHNKITTKASYNFVLRIKGGSFYPQTNSLMLVTQQQVTIYTYILFAEVQFKLDESITFPEQFKCINYDHSVLTKDLIIIQCFNFLGQQEKLILVRDAETNQYIPYNPFVNKIVEDCWLSGNEMNIITVCSNQIKIKQTNFYFLQLSSDILLLPSDSELVNLTVQCTNFDETQQKQMQVYRIGIRGCKLQQAYTNQLITPYGELSYSSVLSLQLKDYFKASNIVDYSLDSDCSFIQPQNYQPIQYLSYFSLYNREKCVQIISGGGELFYRLIQVNQTVFYLEQCLLNKLGYGCQLNQIYEGIQSVRLGFYDYTLIKIFIENGSLKAKYQNTTKEIFDKEVEQLEILDNIIRIKTGSSYYTNTVENIISNCGEWVCQTFGNRYFYDGSTVLELAQDGLLKEYLNGKLQSQILLPILSFNSSQSKNEDNIKLPYVFKKAYYLFIVGQQYISKIYYRNRVIHIYSFPYNSQNYTVNDVTLSDIYLTIQYQQGVFEIYDVQQQEVSARIATIVETIMTDVILLSKDVLLIPIQSETTLIKIQRNPMLTIGGFTPEYSRFHQICKFKLKLGLQNGSCPAQSCQQRQAIEPGDMIYQQFELKIKYNVQEIALGDAVQTQYSPSQCSDCSIELDELQYKGPIFAFQLNDDYFSQFTLIPHIQLSSCSEHQINLLRNLIQIRFQGDSSSEEVMMMDSEYIYVLDQEIQVTSQYKLLDTNFCSSYLKLQQSYVILCNQYLLVLRQNQTVISFKHNQTLMSSNRHTLQLQFQKINEMDYFIYMLDHDITIRLYEFNATQQTIKYVVNYVFKQAIEDMKVVDNRIIILKADQICFTQRNDTTCNTLELIEQTNRDCYQLSDLIPRTYGERHCFEEIVPYYSSQSMIKALLISKNVSSLHIDLNIYLDQLPIHFTITNVYAVYPGFEFSEVISINITDDSYSNFIILYQDQNNKQESYILAYYPYNLAYQGDRVVGQIKSAQFLENYFLQPYNFSFLSFSDSMLITHHKHPPSQQQELFSFQQLSQVQQNKACLFVSIHPKLEIKLNYDLAPPIKFLVLRANNLNSIDSHFIRMHFTQQSNSLQVSFIGFGVTILLFLLLIIATNRCKSTESDIQVHFIREQEEINQPSYEPTLSNQQSSLLHSKGSSEIASDDYEDRSEDGNAQIVMIREQ